MIRRLLFLINPRCFVLNHMLSSYREALVVSYLVLVISLRSLYRKIDDGRKFNGELTLKNFPRKVKTFFKLMFKKICKLISKVK